jgi:predicted transcriptional regulator
MEEKRKRQRKRKVPPPEIKSPATNRALSALLRIIDIEKKEAAAVLGMEPGLLADYVSGKRELPLAEYRRICVAFGTESPGEGLRNLAAYLSGEEPLRERTSAGGKSAPARLGNPHSEE